MARDNALIEERNAAIYKNYKSQFHDKLIRYDVVLDRLSKEFFLKKETIHRIIQAMASKKASKKKDPDNGLQEKIQNQR